ncbi:hypothetical protein [Dendronalium sp. ChiSLP03b]|uniref:hypothetical protein n=1 Tax=Dendronalium sp. ChiSLP03b TaxID=3075381 RepID=UPI002ADBCAFE|nr:hypothetical protein [Dendronalium sp. ChiSLP03b]
MTLVASLLPVAYGDDGSCYPSPKGDAARSLLPRKGKGTPRANNAGNLMPVRSSR